MSYPGSWKKVDTNKWENTVTNDKFKISKSKSVPGTKQSWKGYYEGNKVFDLSPRSNKDSALKAARREMGRRTKKELLEKKKRKKKFLAALKKAREAAKSRSDRSIKLDRNMFNKQKYQFSDPDDVERWAKDPGSGDLATLDTPIDEDKGKEHTVNMLDRRIKAAEDALEEDKYQF